LEGSILEGGKAGREKFRDLVDLAEFTNSAKEVISGN
jgi:hypothetical protein